MSIQSAMAGYETHYKARLQENMFGHLFPDPTTEPKRGQIRFYKSTFRDEGILDYDLDMESSHWLTRPLLDAIDQIEIEYGQIVEAIVEVLPKVGVQYIPWYSEIETMIENGDPEEWVIDYSKVKYFEYLHVDIIEASVILDSLT